MREGPFQAGGGDAPVFGLDPGVCGALDVVRELSQQPLDVGAPADDAAPAIRSRDDFGAVYLVVDHAHAIGVVVGQVEFVGVGRLGGGVAFVVDRQPPVAELELIFALVARIVSQELGVRGEDLGYG